MAKQKQETKAEVVLMDDAELLRDLRQLIEGGRWQAARSVNSELVLLYWRMGKRLRGEVVGTKRAAYGKRVVTAVARRLTAEYGRGFARSNLYRMMDFAEEFPDESIVASLRRQLTWTHLRELLVIQDPLKRGFYIELCQQEQWSTRTLRAKVAGLLFERTAIAKRPDDVIVNELEALKRADQISPDLVFRDPYMLDFLNLRQDHSEEELEAAILRELEAFLLELGTGFTFVTRQKRMSIGADDYYLDLLLFHRPLRSLVAVELKLGRFSARDKGQLELYLRWLDKHERLPSENRPLGLILCTDKNEEQVELLELDKGDIRVAGYMTDLPSKALLQQKLTQAIERARERSSPHATLGNSS